MKQFIATTLFAMPFCVHAGYLVEGGYNWNLNFTDPGNTTSYVIADYDKNTGRTESATNGIANNSLIGKPYGGQTFDGEQMFMEIKNDTLYLAIVTGLNPEHGYASGDILFDLNGDMTQADGSLISDSNFSIANNKYITAKANGSSDGYEFGLVVKDHGNYQKMKRRKYFDFGYEAEAGDIYSLSKWTAGTDIIDKLRPSAGRVENGAETIADVSSGTTSLYYGAGIGIAESLYVIESAIDLRDNRFGDALIASAISEQSINVHWNPLCNNDWLQFTGSLAYQTAVDEPAPMALMLAGLVGLFARRKYQNKV